MKFTVGNRVIEIKFDYRTMFKMNKYLSDKEDSGQSSHTGVGKFFGQIINQDDTAIVDLIRLSAPKNMDISEDQAVTAIETYLDASDAVDPYAELFSDIQSEMIESGFFKSKILNYIKMMERGLDYAQTQFEGTEEEKEVRKAMVEQEIGRMKQAVSLPSAPATE